MSKKVEVAFNLPIVANINPRSVYGKEEELKTFIKEEEVDCTILSESWERVDLPLDNLLKLDEFEIVSNPFQRTGRGGRPVLIINKSKFLIRNITNTVINIPWGVEAVWAVLTPKTLRNNSLIKKIVICGFYSPPKSNAKNNYWIIFVEIFIYSQINMARKHTL